MYAALFSGFTKVKQQVLLVSYQNFFFSARCFCGENVFFSLIELIGLMLGTFLRVSRMKQKDWITSAKTLHNTSEFRPLTSEIIGSSQINEINALENVMPGDIEDIIKVYTYHYIREFVCNSRVISKSVILHILV